MPIILVTIHQQGTRIQGHIKGYVNKHKQKEKTKEKMMQQDEKRKKLINYANNL